jgi:hypothetical protein
VRGDGLEPGKSYKLNWTHVVGNQLMGPGAEQPGRTNWEEMSKVIAESTADPSGNIEFHFSTPDDLGGTQVYGSTSDRQKNSAATGSSRRH